MAQMQRVGNHKTTISTEDGVTRVVYHSTPVVKFDRDTVTLDSGGWLSVTTKARMNQAAAQFALGFGVYQRDGRWFVSVGDFAPIPFHDGMVIDRP